MNGLVIFLVVSLTIVGCRQKSFNSDEWKESKESQYWMLDDLVQSKILIGKNKDEVIELLDTVNIKQYNYSNDGWMFIIEKPKPSSAIQSPVEVLDLTFNDDTITKAEIRK